MKLVGVGDNVVDYYTNQNTIYPGGNALNVAVLSKQNGAEQSGYVGILGNDTASTHIIETLKKEKIDISHTRRAHGENGMAKVKLNPDGDRVFVGSNKGGVQSRLKLGFANEDIDYINSFDLLHTSVFSNIESELYQLKDYIYISFDFSSHLDNDYLKAVCPYITYAFFSGSHLTEDECKDLALKVYQYGVRTIGITRGSKGALFFDEKGRCFKQPVIQTHVIDTLGAGDTFIAVFLTSYFNGTPMEKALYEAAVSAAHTCTYFGAFGYGQVYKQPSSNI
ncbi:PfkB family carbohydrate kinase [Tuberibacillus sp. Marseille-P3662]|uniref:PfkB family carbohydrate kinase n=1 Tax=Tuberibacillus sp. Marseille-P3662 TaxID=1965358 RepID=UPI000A1CBAA2|nr:PfkB family carbohydrate kinase [Tuberibacillus sp. Marseille-P3662]